jgi:F1F0 ATPase subunit 2
LIDLILMRALPYGALGALIGVAYVSALGWNVRLYLDRGIGWSAMLLHLLRLLLVAAAFTICARRGAVPLLSSLVGFLIARTWTVSKTRRVLEAEL